MKLEAQAQTKVCEMMAKRGTAGEPVREGFLEAPRALD